MVWDQGGSVDFFGGGNEPRVLHGVAMGGVDLRGGCGGLFVNYVQYLPRGFGGLFLLGHLA